MSIEKSQSFRHYLKNRVAGLYPEMWEAIILNGVIILTLKFKSLNWFEFFVYQFTQSTIFQFWTPDSLADFSNGPLWTVCVMVQCYVVMWPTYKLLHNKGLKRWIPTLLVLVLINLCKPLLAGFLPPLLYKLIRYTFANHMWLFLVGAFICEYFDVIIPYLKKLWILTFAVEAIFFYALPELDVGAYPIIKSVCILLGSIGFAYCFPKLSVKVDLSYGLYLYHMIVVNVMIFMGLDKKEPIWFVIALAISLLLSALSYFSLGALSRRIKSAAKRRQATG